jgi:hypothetical protein
MTHRTACKFLRSANAVFLDQLASQRGLIRRWFIVHVENCLAGTDFPGRIAMAIQAPFHQQRWNLMQQRHPVDAAVTRRTANALLDMNAMIEVDPVVA